MISSYSSLRSQLQQRDLWPITRLARAAWYSLALAILLFLLEKILSALRLRGGASLGGWVTFLSSIAIVLFVVLAFRWLRTKLLWRLRNRLIVTYMFIGVIPALLLIAMAFVTIYLFAGQFANFVVTSGIDLKLHSVEAANGAIANELAARLERGQPASSESLSGLRKTSLNWRHRQVCAWLDGKPLSTCVQPDGKTAFDFPSFLSGPFRDVVQDDSQLFLRGATVLTVPQGKLLVVSSEPLNSDLVQEIAPDLGEITLYTSSPEAASASTSQKSDTAAPASAQNQNGIHLSISQPQPSNPTGSSRRQETLTPLLTAGSIPPANGYIDRVITFGAPLPAVDWQTGNRDPHTALIRVQTRPSVLYNRLFAALGDFAKGVEYILLIIAIILAIIELLALLIGTRLTRTITGSIAQIYRATQHIDRGDFSHRIPVHSSDQLAQLSLSFNSMTASIEKLIQEQKEKQRLENELVIAQEVQSQLFPRQISQLQSLEVHGFCRPARTVSGDYYDFLAVNSEKMILAVGDVSGKGISAALLMATIHSAVRAYTLEGVPLFREPVAAAVSSGSRVLLTESYPGIEASPGALLALLNHQLFESTPSEKYATLFLGIYDGRSRRLTYSNGGHLPPIIISEDGRIQRLDQGGTVVGLFDNLTFDEATVELRPGDIFLAYSDGVTEPENDFGEFGEDRLLELVRARWSQPLARITEGVTAAVDDWIGEAEQPDDITLVLARAR
jgi:sigma-B regulation protein RsbU (phosphoserine phosphatase)